MRALTDKERRELGHRIQARRKQLRLTQEQVAELSGLSQNYIAVVENGSSGLGDDSIIGLAKGLQVSADYILFGEAGSQDRDRLLKLLKPLNSDQLMGLEEIVKVYLKACGCGEWQDEASKTASNKKGTE